MKQSEARALIRSKITVNSDGCWIWPTSRRYGQVMVNGKSYGAHRLSYLAHNGRIGDKHVLHRCDVTQCINPDHLFLGTHDDNMADMVAKDRSGARELNNRLGKLTDDQVCEIRAKRERGIPVSWIATEYGVAPAYVRDITTRRVKGNYPARHHAG